ncbi:WSC domain-containing protein 2-like isoform X2 [Acanthaster planci]|uniref:WSC domain-containing protein 2-like isoform X2 n=1 Tax=Acanthaster planci TaxID=133434 RepID=A0A8B7Y555_ACAPL|nr:WSC domain-containing protein 2-like isoform X2 [Acanthaster planci]
MRYDMLGFRHLPARMFRYKGLLLIIFALCALSFYFGRYLHNHDEPNTLQAEKSPGDRPALPAKLANEPQDLPQVREQVMSRGRPRPLTSQPAVNHFVSALNKTWMTWTDINSPGVYRACVPRPRDSVSMSEVVTGGLVEKSSMMTITHCLNSCIALGFTYAALSRGAECFCTDVKGESALLSYKDSALCDIPCGGEPRYHCGGRDYMSLYRTSVPDSRCSRIKLKPKGSMPLIALASYPRSGNTWTRQLIERGTGFLTGSVHWKHEKEMAISSKIFPGGNIDYQTRQTVCVKSHLSDTAHIKTFEGAILLIRNPYSALVAEIFRRLMLDQEKSAEETVKYFDSPEWRHFAENQAQSWRNMAVQWITNSHRILVSHYENLQENTYEELAKIVRFLDVPVQTQRILCAIQEYPSSKATGVSLGNHGRKTRVYLTKDPFPPDVRKLVDENIKQVNTTLIEYKLNPLPRDYSVDVF